MILFSYKHPGGLELSLEYEDGAFAIAKIAYLEENDTPGSSVSIERVQN